MRPLLDADPQFRDTPEVAINRLNPARLVEHYSFAGMHNRRVLITPTATRYFDGGIPFVCTARNTTRGVLPLLQDRLVVRSSGNAGRAELLVVDRQATKDQPGQLRKYDITGIGSDNVGVVQTWACEPTINAQLQLAVDHPLGWVKVIDPGVVLPPHDRIDELVMTQLDAAQAAEFALVAKVVRAVMDAEARGLGEV